jgi:2-methylisocitrate lyase-like PEP mutase family enzyme
MRGASRRLRTALKRKSILAMPSAYDPIGARLAEDTGFSAVYNGGFVTGGATCISEPLMSMNEQLQAAAAVAHAVDIPVVADAGGGYGEPLHCMRTVREYIRQGVAGLHIEDQQYPKRAHYHTYVEHMIPRNDFVDKIKYACKERDARDPDFVIIARSDACRIQGLAEAVKRVNMAADVGADMGMIFPRSPAETKRAPKLCRIPLVYVQSRGNRDGRPLYSLPQL